MKDPVIYTERLLLRFPGKEDVERLSAFMERNREHLKPWESTATDSPADLSAQIACWENECKEQRAARFFLLDRKDVNGMLLGMCSFTQIFRGPFQACYLGYKVDSKYEGKGLMFEALKAAIQHMFTEYNLHRIMSNYMPSNLRSANLLERLGFYIEGYARDYLRINNKWEDHILTSLVNSQWQQKLISN